MWPEITSGFFFNDYAATKATGVAGKLSLAIFDLSFEFFDLSFEIFDLSFEIWSCSFDILDSICPIQTIILALFSLLEAQIPSLCAKM